MKRIIELADGARVEVSLRAGHVVLVVTDEAGESAAVAMEERPGRDVSMAILHGSNLLRPAAPRRARQRGRR